MKWQEWAWVAGFFLFIWAIQDTVFDELFCILLLVVVAGYFGFGLGLMKGEDRAKKWLRK
jgi:hypothetical protein